MRESCARASHFDRLRTGLAVETDAPRRAVSGRRRAVAPGFESATWFGCYRPIGLAAEITNRFATELQRALSKADVAERFAKRGAEPVADVGPAKFAAMVEGDGARWAALIRERRISAE